MARAQSNELSALFLIGEGIFLAVRVDNQADIAVCGYLAARNLDRHIVNALGKAHIHILSVAGQIDIIMIIVIIICGDTGALRMRRRSVHGGFDMCAESRLLGAENRGRGTGLRDGDIRSLQRQSTGFGIQNKILRIGVAGIDQMRIQLFTVQIQRQIDMTVNSDNGPSVFGPMHRRQEGLTSEIVQQSVAEVTISKANSPPVSILVFYQIGMTGCLNLIVLTGDMA